MLIRPLNLPLSRATQDGLHPRTLGYSPSFEPGVQKGAPLLVAPAEKFRSRIRFLQLSTGKVTPYGHVLYQFGETSYRFCSFFWLVWILRNQSGDHLPTSHVGSSRPLKPQLSLGRGPGPMQATAHTAFLLTELPQFLSKMASGWSGVGFTPGGTIDSASKTPFFPQKCIKFRSKEGVLQCLARSHSPSS